MATYPLINGNLFSFASVELTVDGRVFRGVKSVDYSQNLEPGEVRGTHAELLGRTRGDLKPSASMELFLEEANELLERLGNGFMERSFSGVVAYEEPGSGKIRTDELVGCRIKGTSDSHSQGTDGLTRKFDLSLQKVRYDGREPLLRPL